MFGCTAYTYSLPVYQPIIDHLPYVDVLPGKTLALVNAHLAAHVPLYTHTLLTIHQPIIHPLLYCCMTMSVY